MPVLTKTELITLRSIIYKNQNQHVYQRRITSTLRESILLDCDENLRGKLTRRTSRSFGNIIREFLKSKRRKVGIEKRIKNYWRNHHNKSLGFRVTSSDLCLSKDSKESEIAYVLNRCKQGNSMRRARVLDFSGMVSFGDINIDNLLEVLAAHKQIFSINLGEKPNVSTKSWEKVIASVNCGHNGIRYCFVDQINCPAYLVRQLKLAIRTQRSVDVFMQKNAGSIAGPCLPEWKCDNILNQLMKKCPSNQRNSPDLAYCKPFWYSKNRCSCNKAGMEEDY